MSRFNTPTPGTKTTNLAGAEAFTQSPELELVSLLLTSFVKDRFYESADDQLARVVSLVGKNDKKFAAKAAIYARTQFGMRSITHAVAGEIAMQVKGEAWTKDFFNKIVHRPDDMTEIRAYYQHRSTDRHVPHAMRKGFAAALERFDEYSLAKYRGEKDSISLVDIVNAVHPRHTDAIAKLVKGELKAEETWEYKITQAGQNAENDEDKARRISEAWNELVMERKLGYFALLRNLRNIIEKAPAEALTEALHQLMNENAIKKSLVLPFRFTTALEQIKQLNGRGVRETLGALSAALEISLSNVPKMPGRTLVAIDTSGSMSGQPSQIATLFGAVLYRTNDADLLTFDTTAQYISLNPSDSIGTIASSIPFHGGGTNFHSIFETMNQAYDRIVILSDMQAWMEGGYESNLTRKSFTDYENRCGSRPHVYSFDLTGHGSMQFPEPKVYALAGFSDKIFDIMKFMEEDRNALVNTIKAVEL